MDKWPVSLRMKLTMTTKHNHKRMAIYSLWLLFCHKIYIYIGWGGMIWWNQGGEV
jgi:hypothetical protein